MQLEVLNKQGKATGRNIEMPDDIFAAEPNNHLIYLAVKQYRAAKHLGLHKSKTRAEANGSSKKLVRQKGTGGARKGNLRNPLYKGGGSVHGPVPHSYTFKINRKEKDIAKISALSHKAKENNIMVLEDLQVDAPKTKEFMSVLTNLSLNGKKVLYIMPEYNENVYLSMRNIPRVKATLLSDTNTYDVMHANVLVFTEEAAKIFSQEDKKSEENEALVS